MIPIKLTAKNFLSFKEFSYQFENKPLAIQGRNLEDKGQESNGSGKSAFNEAFEYCIFGESSRKSITKKLVRYGEKKSELSLTIYCPIREKTLLIERTINLRGSSELKLFKLSGGESPNEYNEVNFSSVPDGNKVILDWMDMNKEDLQSYYIINGEKHKSFFQKTNTEKLALLSRISNIEKVATVPEYVKSDISNTEFELNRLNNDILSSNSRESVYHEQLQREQSRDLNAELNNLLSGKDSQIEYCKNEINTINSKIKTNNSSIAEYNGYLVTVNSNVDKAVEELEEFKVSCVNYTDQFNNLNKQRHSFDTESNELRSLKNEFNIKISEIQNTLAGLISCPKCGHRFHLQKSVDVPAMESRLEELKGGTVMIDEKFNQLSESVKELDVQFNELSDKSNKDSGIVSQLNNTVFKVRNQQSEYVNYINSLTSENDRLSKQISSHESSIQSIEQEKESLKQNGFSNDGIISELNGKINGEIDFRIVKQQQIDQLNSKLIDLKQWSFNFAKFYTFLANKSLNVIQGYCNLYLNRLNSDMELKISGFKTKADGSVSSKITPYVLRGGLEEEWVSFSKGERGRIEYSSILAIQEIINSKSKYGGLNVLLMDEVSDGLDPLGLTLLLKSLSVVEKPILITTHVSNDLGVESLIVQKEFGVSKLLTKNT